MNTSKKKITKVQLQGRQKLICYKYNSGFQIVRCQRNECAIFKKHVIVDNNITREPAIINTVFCFNFQKYENG